jgi:hypothetical protein
MSGVPQVVTVVLLLGGLAPLSAIDSDRDFTGKWVLDPGAGNLSSVSTQRDRALTISQRDTMIHCSSGADNRAARWTYALDGSETRYSLGEETRKSVTKWEGAALLINTLVSGPRNYTVMDRWRLSRDHAVLSITRQIVTATGEAEGILVYRREGDAAPALVPRTTPLSPREPAEAEITIRTGTRIPLTLRNTVDTKHSREGDRIYLETVYPIAQEGRVVIPRGSFVTGVVTESKQPGRVKGKGELFIRFDSLTLPNGVTRDFRSRLVSADSSAAGQVDRKEGKITSEGGKAADARTVATGAGMGATIGGVAGHAIKGVGIGGAAGAAAGLGSVLVKRGPDAALRQGTMVEMILDRDISFQPAELRF